MAYLGEHLRQCHAVPFDWGRTNLVIVSGSGPNPCLTNCPKLGWR